MLYREPDGVVFMDDESFEQIKLPNENIGDMDQWLLEDQVYDIVFIKGVVITAETRPLWNYASRNVILAYVVIPHRVV